MEPIRWITMNGNHIPIYEGQTEEEAINSWIGDKYEKDLPKKREYNNYYLYDTTKEDYELGKSAATGVSKREYEKAIQSGREGYIDEFGKRWGETVPEDIENRMQDAIDSINRCNNWDNFKTQIKQKIFGNGVNANNFNNILDAFDDELTDKYNELIQPKIDAINKIDIDNAPEIFSNSINKMNINYNFKQTLNNMYDGCKDENCKVMISVITGELGTVFEKDATATWDNKKLETCYVEMDNMINFTDDNLDTESLVHEVFHSVYSKYEVNKSELVKTLRNEFNKNVLKQIEQDFGVEAYYKNNKPDEYENVMNFINKEKETRIVKDRAYDKMHKLDKEYENARKEYFNAYTFGLDTSELSEKINALRNNYDEARSDYNYKLNEYKKYKWYADIFKQKAANDFQYQHGNLADMIEGTGITIVDSTPLGFGHGKSYWKDDDESQSNEFFAEMAEMIGTGNNQEIELIRKYIPESVAKFEEIFNSIIKDKGKVLKR